jgi:SAM-dependent methyltransferase
MGLTLNVGCGRFPVAGAVNLDVADGPGVDVVWDLDVGPWPFPDQHFTRVQGIQVFEHVANPVLFIAEAWRVLAPDGVLHLEVPHYTSRNSFTDPTHRRHCTEQTFDYWCVGTPLNGSNGAVYGGDVHRFAKVNVAKVGEDLHATLRRLP